MTSDEANKEERGQPILSASGITKHFGGIHALEGVDMDLYDKEALALLGDNGAGKSTLIKIISGALDQDEGEIRFNGEQVRIADPNDAKELGIKTVHQDLALFTLLDVTSNLFAGEEKTRFGFLQKGKMDEDTDEILEELRVSVKSLRQRVGSLSGGQRHAVAIGRGVYVGHEPSVIIMDEPTAGLGVEESKNVIQLLKDLKKKVSVIFITHNMDYAFDVADRALVLASGRVAGMVDMDETTEEEIVGMMMGKIKKT